MVMKSFGTNLVSYRGTASVEVGTHEDAINVRGYFEAAQFHSGRIAISVVPTGFSKNKEATLTTGPTLEVSFDGLDLEGWAVKTRGETLFSQASWLLAPMAGRPKEQMLSPLYLESKLNNSSDDSYNHAIFSISNFLWDDRFGNEPEQIRLGLGGREVTVKPVDSYLEVAQRLRNGHGTEPTAHVFIKLQDGDRECLRDFEEFVGELTYVLRLVTGNHVDWIFGEAVDDRNGRPVERIHKHGVLTNFSGVMRFCALPAGQASAFPELSLPGLTEAFLGDTGHGLDRVELHELINQFTDACNPTTNIESSGLMASTLTELIAAKHAQKTGGSYKIPEDEFKNNLLPLLKDVIGKTIIPGDIKNHVTNHLRGAYRRSFRQKLKLLNDSLKLELNCKRRGRVVAVRNSLVHEGTYLSPLEDGHWRDDYQLLTWVNFIAICRLCGYDGELPRFQDWQLRGLPVSSTMQ